MAGAAVDMGQARGRAGRLAWWVWELPRQAARDGDAVILDAANELFQLAPERMQSNV